MCLNFEFLLLVWKFLQVAIAKCHLKMKIWIILKLRRTWHTKYGNIWNLITMVYWSLVQISWTSLFTGTHKSIRWHSLNDLCWNLVQASYTYRVVVLQVLLDIVCRKTIFTCCTEKYSSNHTSTTHSFARKWKEKSMTYQEYRN